MKNYIKFQSLEKTHKISAEKNIIDPCFNKFFVPLLFIQLTTSLILGAKKNNMKRALNNDEL